MVRCCQQPVRRCFSKGRAVAAAVAQKLQTPAVQRLLTPFRVGLPVKPSTLNL